MTTTWWYVIWLVVGFAGGWLAAMGLWMWLTRVPKPNGGAHRIEGTDIVYDPDPGHHANH